MILLLKADTFLTVGREEYLILLFKVNTLLKVGRKEYLILLLKVDKLLSVGHEEYLILLLKSSFEQWHFRFKLRSGYPSFEAFSCSILLIFCLLSLILVIY